MSTLASEPCKTRGNFLNLRAYDMGGRRSIIRRRVGVGVGESILRLSEVIIILQNPFAYDQSS